MSEQPTWLFSTLFSPAASTESLSSELKIPTAPVHGLNMKKASTMLCTGPVLDGTRDLMSAAHMAHIDNRNAMIFIENIAKCFSIMEKRTSVLPRQKSLLKCGKWLPSSADGPAMTPA